jgi:pimeloyl-ACP methyl ester carboxylesterase
MPRGCLASLLLLLAALAGPTNAQTEPGGGIQIRVTLPGGSPVVSGRLIVFMTNDPQPRGLLLPGFQPNERLWIAAREVTDLEPGHSVTIDRTAAAVPSAIDRAPRGDYQFMALLDVDHDANYEEISDGDLRSLVVPAKGLDPSAATAVELNLTERHRSSATLRPEGELVDVVSPSLSAFWGRPVHMRQIIILPPGYRSSSSRYPTVYLTHGFGGTLSGSFGPRLTDLIVTQMANGKLPPMIWVLLEQAVASGTHEFADSANNGPWGTALTKELIPELEKRYRMEARPSGRFLNGHSSGGWATAWLQVTHPDVFGGTWSTSPDPVDFHSFTNVDLYTADNLYRDVRGNPTRLLRGVETPAGTMEAFAKREAVLGEYGGQMASFEWVFSPKGDDGRPLPLFNRTTGRIDRSVAEYWISQFDISRLLITRARALAPQLRGKLHFIVGTADTFYLDVPIRRLEVALQELAYDAKFTYLPDRDHFNLYEGDVLTRIAQQMYDVARPRSKWTPSVEPTVAPLMR